MKKNIKDVVERKKSPLAATNELSYGLTFVIPYCKKIIAKDNPSFNVKLAGKEESNA